MLAALRKACSHASTPMSRSRCVDRSGWRGKLRDGQRLEFTPIIVFVLMQDMEIRVATRRWLLN
jgi:hypothetical protein